FRQGVLLAIESGDETPAPDLSARLEQPAGARDVAPDDRDFFPCQGLSEDDAGAAQKPRGHELRARGGGGESGVGARVRFARENAAPSRAQTSFAALRRRQEEPAQAGKRITRYAAQRDELPQALLDKSRQELRRARQFLEEHRP